MVQGAANATAAGYSKHQSTFPMPPLYPRANVVDLDNPPPPSTDLQPHSMDSMSRTLKPYSMSHNKPAIRKARGLSSPHRNHTCKRCAHSQRDHLPTADTPKRKSNRRRSYSSTDSTSSSADSQSSSESDSSSYTSYSSTHDRLTRGRPTVDRRPGSVVRPRQVSLNPLSMYVPSKEHFVPQGAHIHPAVAPYVQPNSIYSGSQPSVYRQPSQTRQQPTTLQHSPSPSHTHAPSTTQPQQPLHQSLRVTADQHPSMPPGYHSPTTFRTSGQAFAAYQGNVAGGNIAGVASTQAYQGHMNASGTIAPSPTHQGYHRSPTASSTQAASPSPAAYQQSPAHMMTGSPTRGLALYREQQGIPTTVSPTQTIVLEQSPTHGVASYPPPGAAAERDETPSEYELSAKQGTDQYEYSPAARGVYPMSALPGVGETIGVGESLGGTTGGGSLYGDSTHQAESAIFLPDFRGRSRGVKKARQGCCG